MGTERRPTRDNLSKCKTALPVRTKHATDQMSQISTISSNLCVANVNSTSFPISKIKSMVVICMGYLKKDFALKLKYSHSV